MAAGMDHPPYSWILCPVISVSPDPLRSSWLAGDLCHADIKQALISRLQTPDTFLPYWDISLGATVEQMLKCHWCLWRSDVYRMLPMCHVYIEGSMKFSASEFWLPNFLTLLINHINKKTKHYLTYEDLMSSSRRSYEMLVPINQTA